MRDRSSLFIDDADLQALETFARRMRGEIFFAKRWLIVEGPTDYLIVHAVAHALEYDLDQHGVSVIDAQNNGNPATFAALTRALDIPWLAVFDGDKEGRDCIQRIGKRGFDASELQERCHTHQAGDIEEQLVADGLGPELRETLETIGIPNARGMNDKELVAALRKRKNEYAWEIAIRIRSDPRLAHRLPITFRDAIKSLRGLE